MIDRWKPVGTNFDKDVGRSTTSNHHVLKRIQLGDRAAARSVPFKFVVVLMAATGCGSSETDPPAPGPTDSGVVPDAALVANQPPDVSLRVVPAIAGAPSRFSAVGSSDPEGGALTFDWDFGDGARGSQVQVVHVYAEAGTYTVTLSVRDDDGQVVVRQEMVTVVGQPVAMSRTNLELTVKDATGTPIPDARVVIEPGTLTTTTSVDTGMALINDLPVDRRLMVTVSAEGFVTSRRGVTLPEVAEASIQLVLVPAAPTLVDAIDADMGGTATGAQGAQVILPAGALIDANGRPISGSIDVRLTPLDIREASALAAFPGGFDAFSAAGEERLLLSYGTTEFELRQGGEKLDLAPSASATVRLPLFVGEDETGAPLAEGTTIPLWSLDPRTGYWIREGEGTVIASADAPSGWVLEATVEHFSWWNCDVDPEPARLEPDIRYDADGDGPLAPGAFGPPPQAPTLRGRPAEGWSGPRSGRNTPAPWGASGPYAIPPDQPLLVDAISNDGLLVSAPQTVMVAPDVQQRIEIIMRPVTDGGGPLRAGVPVQAGFAEPGDRDLYTFEGVAGEVVLIRAARSGPQSMAEGVVEVLDPRGDRQAPTVFGATPAQIALQLPADGTYAVRLRSLGQGVGGYTLSLTNFGPGLDLDVPVNTVTATLADEGFVWLPFVAEAADIMTVEVAALREPVRGRVRIFRVDANADTLMIDDVYRSQGTFEPGPNGVGAHTVRFPFPQDNPLGSTRRVYRVRVDASTAQRGPVTLRYGVSSPGRRITVSPSGRCNQQPVTGFLRSALRGVSEGGRIELCDEPIQHHGTILVERPEVEIVGLGDEMRPSTILQGASRFGFDVRATGTQFENFHFIFREGATSAAIRLFDGAHRTQVRGVTFDSDPASPNQGDTGIMSASGQSDFVAVEDSVFNVDSRSTSGASRSRAVFIRGDGARFIGNQVVTRPGWQATDPATFEGGSAVVRDNVFGGLNGGTVRNGVAIRGPLSIVEGNHITMTPGPVGSGISVTPTGSGSATQGVIRGNVVRNGHEGITVRRITNALVERNRIESVDVGIRLIAADGELSNNSILVDSAEEGISVTGGTESGLRIINNTLRYSGARFTNAIVIRGEGNGAFVLNNLLSVDGAPAASTMCGLRTDEVITFADSNLVHGFGQPYCGLAAPQPNDVSGDPLFAGPDTIELMPQSPAVDAGSRFGASQDYRGRARPLGNGFDIGAAEQ